MLTAEERYRQYRWGILAQACDEAPIGVWEPYWSANNVLRDLPVEERLEWAERAMLELLGKGLIYFYGQRMERWRSVATFVQRRCRRCHPRRYLEVHPAQRGRDLVRGDPTG